VIFGHTVCRCETVTSTQDIAKEKALRGEPAGTVITATYQTGGRGRRGRGWFAPKGANVCMTIIGPPVRLVDAWQLAIVAGAAVAEGIQAATATTPAVRFPNDILYAGMKLGGVLIETVPHRETGRITPLIGIGVNVNVPEGGFPDDLRKKSTSLLRITGTEHSAESVQRHILNRLGVQWDAFESGLFGTSVLPCWQALADPDARRVFVIEDRHVSCRVRNLTADGTLTLETPAGDLRSFHASQVIFGDD
jgi:BirA family biotin operon repressor/biotin-[acetyl-CoA-carboxylase] ligase